jgi:Ca-activated chloride channel family protein
MAKRTRNGLSVLLALSVITLGMHACYRANAQTREQAERTESKEQRPWKVPATVASPAPAQGTITVRSGDDSVKVSALTDRTAVLRDGDATVHVEVSIDTDGRVAASRAPSDIVVIVDRSGSMSGQKIEYAKRALRELVYRLTSDDRFGLVEYENSADVLVPLSHVTEGARANFLRTIDRLDVGGGTNMSAGLDLGIAQMTLQREPSRSARVLLLSDGLANQGDSSLSGLTMRAGRAVRGEFVLSTMGIGSDFDETVMTSLARAGTGAFYYLAKLETLPAFLDAELKTANETYAQAAALRFRPAPGVRITSASGIVFEHRGDEVLVPLGSLYAGQKQRVWLTLEVPVTSLGDHELGEIGLTYRRNGQSFEQSALVLPKVASVVDPAVFRSKIVQPVWERATVEAELASAQEKIASAIGSGNSSDVDRALARVPEQRRLAQDLKSQRVLDALVELERRGDLAKRAQVAPAPERNAASKRENAEAFSRSRPSVYKNIAPDYGY